MKKINFKQASPLFLTAMAVVGTVATAVLAVRATPKAIEYIQLNTGYDHDGVMEVPSKEEIVKATWKYYIPAATVGLSTIICILGANALNRRQQATLAGAYALIDQAYKEYRNKAKELYGEESDQNIRTSVVKDRKDDVPKPSEGKILFFDELSYRYFESTMLDVTDAEYQLNRKFAIDGEVYLSEFYDLLGLPRTEFSEVAKWDYDSYIAFCGYQWIDFEHDLVVMDDGLECYIIHIPFSPKLA